MIRSASLLCVPPLSIFFFFFFFFFNDTATTEIYTLSLHDALPISSPSTVMRPTMASLASSIWAAVKPRNLRSEEHTSELQSQSNLVCRLLLEKKKKNQTPRFHEPTKQSKSHIDTQRAHYRRYSLHT